MSLQSLSAAELIELGGLKKRCSAGLLCVAHGLSVPCDACELEGTVGVVCDACGHHFLEGAPTGRDRSCLSETEFLRTGKIAFEDAASAALQAQEKLEQKSVDRERSRINPIGHGDVERRRLLKRVALVLIVIAVAAIWYFVGRDSKEKKAGTKGVRTAASRRGATPCCRAGTAYARACGTGEG